MILKSWVPLTQVYPELYYLAYYLAFCHTNKWLLSILTRLNVPGGDGCDDGKTSLYHRPWVACSHMGFLCTQRWTAPTRTSCSIKALPPCQCFSILDSLVLLLYSFHHLQPAEPVVRDYGSCSPTFGEPNTEERCSAHIMLVIMIDVLLIVR